MPTVDDLIVSLRIDETSNLGELHKQLTTLVGKKGEKKIDISVFDNSLKRELISIKTELSYISSQAVPEIKDVKLLSESLHRDRKVLQRTFDASADRLISEKTDAYQKQLDEYGANNREELLEKMKEVLSNFIGMMELGAMEKLPAKVMQKVAVVSKELIAKQKISDGDRKTLVTKMEKAIGELNNMFSKVLTKAGIVHKPEFNLYQIRESWYRKMGLDKDDIGFDVKTLLGSNEDVITEFDKIKDLVSKGGLYDFIEASFKKLGITPGLETFTAKGIKNEPGLQAIARGILLKAWGTKAGIPTGFHEIIRKILDGVGLNTKELYEKGRPDFLLINNKLDDLIKIFPEDVAKSLNQLVSFIELKSVLSESNKEQFKFYKDLVGKDFLVGVAALVKSSFIDYFPEIKTARVNIVNLLKGFAPEKFKTEEQLKEMSEARMRDEQEKRNMEAILLGLDDTEQFGEDVMGVVDKSVEKAEKEQYELMKKLLGIEKTGEETLEEVKKENRENIIDPEAVKGDED